MMDVALLAARLLLAVVFLVAGLAKLADRAGSRQTLVDFGVPAPYAGPLGVLLPLAELACSAALVPRATAWWGALGALMLLLVFVGGIAYNLARGRTPDCHCFGQLHSAPVGWSTLTRNAVLTMLAGLVIWAGPASPGLSAVGWIGALPPFHLVGLVLNVLMLGLLIAVGWVLLELFRQNGRLVLRIEALEEELGMEAAHPAPSQLVAGLPLGALAPPFSLNDLKGETMSLDVLRASGMPVLLVFTDPGCGSCHALLPDLASWQRAHAGKVTIVLISRGTVEANRAAHYVSHVLLQQDQEIAQAYGAHGTPSAVLVRPEGTIGSRLVAGVEAIRALVVQVVMPPPAPHGRNGQGTPAPAPPLRLGDPVPELALPDLSGTLVNLADLRSRATLVLFWNPGCGFCQRMLEDVKAWEAKPPQGAPQLLIVSTGTVEANQAMGLRSPIVLDQGFTAGRTLGARGTPMAVLLDTQGHIASEVVAGAPAVMALANGQKRLTRLSGSMFKKTHIPN